MKRFLPLLAALTLSACTANQVMHSLPIVGDVCTAAEGTLIDEKAVHTAFTIYVVPANAYLTANRAGQLSPELKARLKPLLIELYKYALTIKAAKGTINCDFAAMRELQGRVTALLPTGG